MLFNEFESVQKTAWIGSETIYTQLGTGPWRMSVVSAQHIVPASNDRMDRPEDHLHAAGLKAQADVCR